MSEPDTLSSKDKDKIQYLSIGAWVLCGMLALDLVVEMSERVGKVVMNEAAMGEIVSAFWSGLVVQLPGLFIICALFDIAIMFDRAGEGEIFTHRNVKSLRLAGDSLALAGLAAAVFTPTLLSWITGEGRGFEIMGTPLSLGAIAMGLALSGVSVLFQRGVALREENEHYI